MYLLSFECEQAASLLSALYGSVIALPVFQIEFPFLDTSLNWDARGFITTNAYRKDTRTGQYLAEILRRNETRSSRRDSLVETRLVSRNETRLSKRDSFVETRLD